MAEGQRSFALEAGWMLTGEDGGGRPLRLVIGETQLRRAYLGVAIGRHPLLCEIAIDDPTLSRRHARLSLAADGLAIEDLNSLNGSAIDDAALPPFAPTPLPEGAVIALGRTLLTVTAIRPERR